jgi:hypothetical protein
MQKELEKRVCRYLKRAKKEFKKEGELLGMMYVTVGKDTRPEGTEGILIREGQVIGIPFNRPDNEIGRPLWQQMIRQIITEVEADSVIIVSEAWLSKPGVWEKQGLRPSQDPERQEALLIIGLAHYARFHVKQMIERISGRPRVVGKVMEEDRGTHSWLDDLFKQPTSRH